MAERFYECRQCKNPKDVKYKQIIDESVREIECCAHCPELSKCVYNSEQEVTEGMDNILDQSCAICHTRGRDIFEGNLVGCVSCYETFRPVIIYLLKKQNLFPNPVHSLFQVEGAHSFHVGHNPFDGYDLQISKKLNDLQIALQQAVKGEHFEQAAWIRDQIRGLTTKGEHERSNT
jgi:protein arginine kinase activator